MLARIDAAPAAVARAVAWARVGLGLAFLLAPRALLRRAVRADDPTDTAVAALRMVAGRDLAVGVGTLLAAGGDGSALRRWVQVSAAIDGIDSLALLPARSLRGFVRFAGAASAAASAGIQLGVTQRLHT
jgi:hypothetical protein